MKTETKECIPPNGVDPTWVGDLFCDDALNTPQCNYDGGDCCNPQAVRQRPYCIECQCIAEGSQANIAGNDTYYNGNEKS